MADDSPSNLERSSSEDTARRVLDALRRSAVRARRVAAQTGTRRVVVRDGELVVESIVREGRCFREDASEDIGL